MTNYGLSCKQTISSIWNVGIFQDDSRHVSVGSPLLAYFNSIVQSETRDSTEVMLHCLLSIVKALPSVRRMLMVKWYPIGQGIGGGKCGKRGMLR